MSALRIRLDPDIPESKGAFDDLGTVVPFDPAEVAIDPRAVSDAQVLIVRSLTRIDDALLRALPELQVVATPIVGLDHVDPRAVAAFERRHGRALPVVHAPGATADGVADWVIAALAESRALPFDRPGAVTVGILGLGHCGGAVARRLDLLGIPWVACDPPRRQAGDAGPWVSHDALADCDIVTVHVPLTRVGEGPWPTSNLLDAPLLENLGRGRCRFLVNSSRGAVLDEQAVLRGASSAAPFPRLILDVYRDEPCPSPELVAMAAFATPHVAGNVIEGRQRAIRMVHDRIARLLGLRQPSVATGGPSPKSELAQGTEDGVLVDVPAWVRTTGLGSCASSFRRDYPAAAPDVRASVFRRIRGAAMRREGRWERPFSPGISTNGGAGIV